MAKADFKTWYAENKEALAQKRQKRYAEDPQYRELVKARSADYRVRTKAENPKPSLPGMTIAETCASLEISEWTLNSWRNQNYYPDPDKVSGRPVFTSPQVELLQLVKKFFQTYPRRLAGLHRPELGEIVDVIHHNWS